MKVINRSLIIPKLHYFLVYSTMGGTLPFVMTMSIQLGASMAMVGLIYSTLPFIMMLAMPCLGSIADKFQQKKAVFLASIALMTTSLFALYFVPPIAVVPSDQSSTNITNISLVCHEKGLSLHTCNVDGHTHILAVKETIAGWNLSATDHHKPTAICFMTCTMTDATDHLVASMCDKMYFCENSTSAGLANESLWLLKLFSEVVSARNHSDHCLGIPVFLNDTDDGTANEHTCQEDTILAHCHGSCQAVVRNYHDGQKVDMDASTVNSYDVTAIDAAAFQFSREIVLLWLCLASAWIGMGGVISMGDTIVIDLLDNKSAFGRQRLWGGMGWGLVSIVSGQLVDMVSRGQTLLNFTPCYFLTLVSGALNVAVVSQIRVEEVERPRHIFKNVLHLFTNLSICVFAISVFLVGTLTGIQWTFLIVYMNELGASQMLIGLSMAVECFLGEIPFQFISGWFLKRIGHAQIMSLVLITFGARFVFYSYISDAWMVIPVGFSMGITFGIFSAALASYPIRIAPINTQATLQGIFQGLFEGLGVGIGTFVGGIMYQSLGGKMMFYLSGLFSGVIAVVVGSLQFWLSRRSVGLSTEVGRVTEQDTPDDDGKQEEKIRMCSSETPDA